jgi:8-oxo-dGTP pyrophosphatase MutT (NUDIX family)
MTSDLPNFILSDARRFYASGAEPALPRPASTVLLLRPAEAPGYQVYLMRRATSMAFAGGMYAFPGGSVDPRDAQTDLAWVAPPNRLGLPERQARAVVCAAVREVFEETGVLLAGPTADSVLADVSTPDWAEARQAVESRALGFAELLRSRGLVLRGDLLAAWSRWITPEFEPRRYDTFFFLARLPEGQLTRRGGEASHDEWLAPAAAAGLPMLPPTRVTLGQLAGCGSIDEAMAVAAGRDAATPVQPRLEGNRLIT